MSNIKIELSEYEVDMLVNALREVYKQNGVEFWELIGEEGECFANKIDEWAGWPACERRVSGTFVDQPTLCLYFACLICDQSKNQQR